MKRLKMVLYGEPGVGKSVFASKAPKPFFITTDGNYEWLEEFGAKPEDHIQVSGWAEAKKAFEMNLDKYETIVLDLTEDLFKWCEYEFCARNKIDHLSDLGYGKAYDITRNEFFIEMCKLINMDKNVIFIMHGITFTTKDRRGVEHTKYGPTNRIPDKVIDMLEGRVRYFLRCYLKAEEQSDGTLLKKRYLSIIPKENEFGIARGLDENKIPHDIELDFSLFADIIGLNNEKIDQKIEQIVEEKPEEKPEEQIEQPRRGRRKKSETVEQVNVDNANNDNSVNVELNVTNEKIEEKLTEKKSDSVNDDVVKEEIREEAIKAETLKREETVEEQNPVTETNVDDTMARIKAKLAALKAAKAN